MKKKFYNSKNNINEKKSKKENKPSVFLDLFEVINTNLGNAKSADLLKAYTPLCL